MLCPGRRGSVRPVDSLGVLSQGRAFRWNKDQCTTPRPPIANEELWICFELMFNWPVVPYVMQSTNKAPRANTGIGQEIRTGVHSDLDPPRVPAEGCCWATDGPRKNYQNDERFYCCEELHDHPRNEKSLANYRDRSDYRPVSVCFSFLPMILGPEGS